MDNRLASGLHARGWRCYEFIEPNVYRLMCSWSTTEEEISSLLTDILAIK
jgi:threonine aldolase